MAFNSIAQNKHKSKNDKVKHRDLEQSSLDLYTESKMTQFFFESRIIAKFIGESKSQLLICHI